MPVTTVNGLEIAYELHGEGDPVAITPGGRFSMDTNGVRELAQALAAGGKTALIWDRPNTGASDLCFDGDFESNMHADTLAGLLVERDHRLVGVVVDLRQVVDHLLAQLGDRREEPPVA